MRFSNLMKYNHKFNFKANMLFLLTPLAVISLSCIILNALDLIEMGGMSAFQIVAVIWAFLMGVSTHYEDFQITTAHCISRKTLITAFIATNFVNMLLGSIISVIFQIATNLIIHGNIDLINLAWIDISSFSNPVLKIFAMIGLLFLCMSVCSLTFVVIHSCFLKFPAPVCLIMIFALGFAPGFMSGMDISISGFFKKCMGLDVFTPKGLTISALIILAVEILLYTLIMRRVKFDQAALQKSYNN